MLIPFIVPFLIAMFLAINMGGSGTAAAFSAAYGADVIKKSLIPGLFGIMVFLGAIIGGEETAKTVGRGILDPDKMTYIIVSIILLSVALSLFIANLLGVPQSTSQAAVLAVSGPAVYLGAFQGDMLFNKILPAWIITPFIAFFVAFLVGKYIYKPIRKTGITISKQLNDNYILKGVILVMALYNAFAIGANNVANATGPITTMAVNELNVADTHVIHIMILATLIIAPSFGIGSSLFGHKIVSNTGKEIVLFGRIEAAIITFISASILLSSSFMGIPVADVQITVGAIIGIGVAKMGFVNIFKKNLVSRVFAVWFIAPAFAFGLSIFLTYLADTYGFINMF